MTGLTAINPITLQPIVPQAAASTPAQSTGVSFGDVVDALNPLQHIPVISSLYRAATGSQISSGSQIVGDTIYGAGLFGIGGAITSLASSAADAGLKAATGQDISDRVVAALNGGSTGNAASTTIPGLAAGKANAVALAQNALQRIYPGGSAYANTKYQNAQAFDAIEQKLLKMAV